MHIHVPQNMFNPSNSAVSQKVTVFAAPFQQDVHYWIVAQFAELKVEALAAGLPQGFDY